MPPRSPVPVSLSLQRPQRPQQSSPSTAAASAWSWTVAPLVVLLIVVAAIGIYTVYGSSGSSDIIGRGGRDRLPPPPSPLRATGQDRNDGDNGVVCLPVREFSKLTSAVTAAAAVNNKNNNNSNHNPENDDDDKKAATTSAVRQARRKTTTKAKKRGEGNDTRATSGVDDDPDNDDEVDGVRALYVRDKRVLHDQLYPPRNRAEADVVLTSGRAAGASLSGEGRRGRAPDTFRLLGYFKAEGAREGERDVGNNVWKCFGRMKDRHVGEFYAAPANTNDDIKIPLTGDMLASSSEKLRDIYTLPAELRFRSPFFLSTPYTFVELPKTDLSADMYYV